MTTLDSSDVDRFRAWVASHFGLALENTRAADLFQLLEERSGAPGISGVPDYLRRLESGLISRDEIRALAERLTIGETYFFRHPDQFKALEQAVLPDRIQARADSRELRILSAGCSSGEELYSISFLIRRSFPACAGWKLALTGIDLNRAALEKARRAVYSSWSLRETPEAIRSQLFSRSNGKEYFLDGSLRTTVTFEEKNLVEEDPVFWAAERFDVIFCRNALMYFSRETMRTVVSRLARSLLPDGYLFLSPAETLRGLSHEFHLRHTHESFYYQKLGAKETASRGHLGRSNADKQVVPSFQAPVIDGDGTWVSRISEASAHIGALATRSSLQRSRSDAYAIPIESAGAPSPSRGGTKLETVHELFKQEKYSDAMQALQALPADSAADLDVQLLHAVVLINRGRIDEAKDRCSRVLLLDEMNAGAHYLMGLAYEHSNEHELAREQDLMAIYLDPTFAMPHLHLGLMARKTGDGPGRRRELKEAIRLLDAEDPSRILLFGGGFSREALIKLCQAELMACEGAGNEGK